MILGISARDSMALSFSIEAKCSLLTAKPSEGDN